MGQKLQDTNCLTSPGSEQKIDLTASGGVYLKKLLAPQFSSQGLNSRIPRNRSKKMTWCGNLKTLQKASGNQAEC